MYAPNVVIVGEGQFGTNPYFLANFLNLWKRKEAEIKKNSNVVG